MVWIIISWKHFLSVIYFFFFIKYCTQHFRWFYLICRQPHMLWQPEGWILSWGIFLIKPTHIMKFGFDSGVSFPITQISNVLKVLATFNTLLKLKTLFSKLERNRLGGTTQSDQVLPKHFNMEVFSLSSWNCWVYSRSTQWGSNTCHHGDSIVLLLAAWDSYWRSLKDYWW